MSNRKINSKYGRRAAELSARKKQKIHSSGWTKVRRNKRKGLQQTDTISCLLTGVVQLSPFTAQRNSRDDPGRPAVTSRDRSRILSSCSSLLRWLFETADCMAHLLLRQGNHGRLETNGRNLLCDSLKQTDCFIHLVWPILLSGEIKMHLLKNP